MKLIPKRFCNHERNQFSNYILIILKSLCYNIKNLMNNTFNDISVKLFCIEYLHSETELQ